MLTALVLLWAHELVSLTHLAMLPMLAVRTQLGTLLAADATTLAPASTPNKIALIVANFTPNENLAIGDLTFATTNGLAALAGVAGTQGTGIDPVSLSQIITLLPPTTGWRWVSSGTIASPITVYGFALIDNGAATLFAVQAFDAPITITTAGEQIDIDPVQLTFVLQPLN